jgi:hypothetical protein
MSDQTSWHDAGFWDFWNFARDLNDWFSFGLWVHEVHQEPARMNEARMSDLELLCQICYAFNWYVLYELRRRGYTDEMRNWFCEIVAPERCYDGEPAPVSKQAMCELSSLP